MNSFFKGLLILAGILILSIYFPISPKSRYILTLVGFWGAFFSMKGESKAIVLFSFFPHLLGTLFYVYKISIPAYPIIIMLGFWCVRHNLLYYYDRFQGKILWLVLMLFFLIEYILGPMHTYSTEKMLFIFINGVVYTLMWMICVLGRNVEVEKISICLLFLSLVYIAIAFNFYDYSLPNDVTDLNFFRRSYVVTKDQSFTYHSVGIPVMLGLAFLISTKEYNFFSFWYLLLSFVLLVVVLLSQTRQALFGCLLIILLKLFFDKRLKGYIKFFILFVLFGVICLAVNFLKSDVIVATMNSENIEGFVNRDLDYTMTLISNNLFFGVGLGGYSMDGGRAYPHNLFLELLCETGLVGLFIVLLILTIPFFKNYVANKQYSLISNSRFIVILPIVGFFIRAMASSDLMSSINFLMAVIVFASVCVTSKKNQVL